MSVAAGALVDDALPRVIRRVAIPAVASNLLMTLFASMDAYWVGTRIGPDGLAAVSTAMRTSATCSTTTAARAFSTGA